MPELPEVETVVRSIRPLIEGQVIRSVVFSSRFVTQGDFDLLSRALVGRRIERVRRTGKHIFIDLDRGLLHVHLGMTGKLLWNAPQTAYARAVIDLDHGQLIYDDIRQFGRVNFYIEGTDRFEKIGPDALTLSFENFFRELRRRSAGIKATLLNQNVVSGIGNIYADEILFAAGIHPQTVSSRISAKRAKRLYTQMQRILTAAILHRGSSISDYVDSNGKQGSYQQMHQVYGKTGGVCVSCGASIRRIVVAQRGTHYCPRCQRR